MERDRNAVPIRKGGKEWERKGDWEQNFLSFPFSNLPEKLAYPVHFFSRKNWKNGLYLYWWKFCWLNEGLIQGFHKKADAIKHTHAEGYEINGNSGKVLDSPLKFWKRKGTGKESCPNVKLRERTGKLSNYFREERKGLLSKIIGQLTMYDKSTLISTHKEMS